MVLHSNIFQEMSEHWLGKPLKMGKFKIKHVLEPTQRNRVTYVISVCLRYHSLPFHCKRSNVLTALWIWLIKCMLLKSSFYKKEVMVKGGKEDFKTLAETSEVDKHSEML